MNEKVLIPLIRKLYPAMIAHMLVSVQPMNEETGIIFKQRYRYIEPTSFSVVGFCALFFFMCMCSYALTMWR